MRIRQTSHHEFLARNQISSAWYYRLRSRPGGAEAIDAYARETEQCFEKFTAALVSAGVIKRRGRPATVKEVKVAKGKGKGK